MSLRILITNQTLSGHSGTEMYVYDLARRLLARGYEPIVYSPALGPLAQQLADEMISVVDDLAQIVLEPDVVHGQHSFPALEALLHFPQAPAIYVCHDSSWVHDTPPILPRIHRYIAVDRTVRERLIAQERIAAQRVDVVFNGVDLNRFRPREALPQRPGRALAISNYMQPSQVDVLRAVCQRHDIELDAVGEKLGGACERPEELLPHYDLVFAKARCAWEALAVGAAVIVCDASGLGPLVTSRELPALREANFGRRLLSQPMDAEHVAAQIARYRAADAMLVSAEIRATAHLDLTVDRLLGCYADAIVDRRKALVDLAGEMRAIAAFLRRWPAVQSPLCSAPTVKVEQRPLTERQFRRIIRDELRGQHQTHGLRKVWRSVRKRLAQFTAFFC